MGIAHVRESMQCISQLLRSLLSNALAEDTAQAKRLFRMVAAACIFALLNVNPPK